MRVVSLSITDVKLLIPRRFEDSRGYFMEVYSRRDLLQAGLVLDFVQDNQSLSRPPGVVRGLHFQRPPFAQTKLVRVLRGSVLDVAVDLRHGSPTFGQDVTATLSADNMHQLLVPAGFAHGFCTLEPDTEVLYKVTAPYSPEHDDGVRWDDPELGIEWPVSVSGAILSPKDGALRPLAELPPVFHFSSIAGGPAGVATSESPLQR